MQRPTSSRSNFADKWSLAIEGRGFCAVPNCLLYCQANLGLTDIELAVLLNLLAHKFTAKHPYPAAATIGKHIGKSHQTVRASLRSMEHKGILRRIPRKGTTSEYDVSPLIHKLEHHTCSNPIEKQIGAYPILNRPPYSFSNTKEDNPRRKMNKNEGFSSIGDNLGKINLQGRR